MARRYVGETVQQGENYTAFLRIQGPEGHVEQVIHLSRNAIPVKFETKADARTALAILIRGLRFFQALRDEVVAPGRKKRGS